MKTFEVEVNGNIYKGDWCFDYRKDVIEIENVVTSVETDNGWTDCPINEPDLLVEIRDKVEVDYEDDIAVEQEEAKWERWNASQECLRGE
jgi:hypothetical protein